MLWLDRILLVKEEKETPAQAKLKAAKSYLISAYEPNFATAIEEACHGSAEYADAKEYVKHLEFVLAKRRIRNPSEWLTKIYSEAKSKEVYAIHEENPISATFGTFCAELNQALTKRQIALSIIPEEKHKQLYDYLHLQFLAHAAYIEHVDETLNPGIETNTLEYALAKAFDGYFSHGSHGGLGKMRYLKGRLAEMDMVKTANRWYDNLVIDWMKDHEHYLTNFYDQEELSPPMREVVSVFIAQQVRDYFAPAALQETPEHHFLIARDLLISKIGQKKCNRLEKVLQETLYAEHELQQKVNKTNPARTL